MQIYTENVGSERESGAGFYTGLLEATSTKWRGCESADAVVAKYRCKKGLLRRGLDSPSVFKCRSYLTFKNLTCIDDRCCRLGRGRRRSHGVDAVFLSLAPFGIMNLRTRSASSPDGNGKKKGENHAHHTDCKANRAHPDPSAIGPSLQTRTSGTCLHVRRVAGPCCRAR